MWKQLAQRLNLPVMATEDSTNADRNANITMKMITIKERSEDLAAVINFGSLACDKLYDICAAFHCLFKVGKPRLF